MLVLTRKCQEVIVVGQARDGDPMVKITVLEVENGKVRLGIEAAPDVPVHRLEVWERIHANVNKTGPGPKSLAMLGPPISHDPSS